MHNYCKWPICYLVFVEGGKGDDIQTIGVISQNSPEVYTTGNVGLVSEMEMVSFS